MDMFDNNFAELLCRWISYLSIALHARSATESHSWCRRLGECLQGCHQKEQSDLCNDKGKCCPLLDFDLCGVWVAALLGRQGRPEKAQENKK